MKLRFGLGGSIDRSKTLRFRFDGHAYSGFAGDTLASALLAEGVRLVARSFKYHRPRGILTAGNEEPNAIVELRGGSRREPNTRATTIELFEGLEARSQHRWPSLAFDVGAVNSLFSPLFVAGFYYKTFMWPAAFWERVYEPIIRRAAGLGRASSAPDPDVYDKAHAFCDVLVIGGGAAGLSAALAAGRAGARVILCDEDFLLGGRLNADRREIGGMPGAQWALQTVRELESLPDVRILRRTTVFGAYDGGTFGALERVSDHLADPLPRQPRQCFWKIVARHAVLAAGAIERPIVFGDNDRPGVMMASAVRAYVNRFGVCPGHRIALFTATDDGWQTIADLADAGASVEAIVDVRPNVDGKLRALAKRVGAREFLGGHVIGTSGVRSLSAVEVRNAAGDCQRIKADLLAVAGGWNPNLALTTHLGGSPRWSTDIAAFVPDVLPASLAVVGAARGSYGLSECLLEGASAGREAAARAGFQSQALPVLCTDDELRASAAFWFVENSKGKAFVDFQNDVTRADIALAVSEGFHSPDHLKRYTTLGMGTDQGKTANVNGLALLASLSGRAIDELGPTRFRPPSSPVAIGALAGRHRGKDFRPCRLTAGHAWAQEQGATFVEVGQWLRAQWFASPRESEWLDTVVREVNLVRSGAGVCDVSTLGKIDIQGPDAGQFLDRVYINTFTTLPVGKVRYGVMLREDGFVFDDGTSARFGDDHYVMSTTTANAARVMQHLEHARQVIWPELDVQIVSVTDQWSQFAVAGPRSRDVMKKLLGSACDVSNEAFPHLACAQFVWRGITVRLFRVSFSGELGYELAVPARHGDAAVRAIAEAGREWRLVPYGTESLGVMRVEKGHVAGNELNGTTTAADLGFGRMMSASKDFIGRTLAGREALIDADRPTLVGLRPIRHDERLTGGAHLLKRGAAASLENDQGYVTSVAYSPTLGFWIGLGLLNGGQRRVGERIRAIDLLRGADIEVEVTSPIFVDPAGQRLRA